MPISKSTVLRVSVTLWLVTLAGAQAVWAQSLGDVARREADRRQQLKSQRVYTNEDLSPVAPASAPPVAPAAATVDAEADKTSAAAGQKEAEADAPSVPVDPEQTLAARREKRPEEYWRSRARAVRAALEKAETDAAQAEIRLKQLAGAPQTPAVQGERDIAAKALKKLQADVQYRRDEQSRFEAFAAAQKVPPDWIR